MKCVDHLEFINEICPDCELEVNEFGNTEYQFQYCQFPCCGCDGARLCMAEEPSNDAIKGNVEGMWSNGSKESRKGRLYTYELSMKYKLPGED